MKKEISTLIIVFGTSIALGSSPPLIHCTRLFSQLLTDGNSPREAARIRQGRKMATEWVAEEFQNLKADPAFQGRSDKFLWETARDKIHANIPSKEAREYFNAAIQQIERGKEDFLRQLNVFNDPLPHLRSLETTPAEDKAISERAFKALTAKGKDTANASHIADHLSTIESVEKELVAAGIPPSKIIRNVLLHDLGKEYDQLPSDFRAFLENVFPLPTKGPDTSFLQRVILSHELGSMILTEQFAKEVGIAPEKLNRLKALYAHHNAGYDPELSGFHFWVQPFAWGSFAKGMMARGLPVPGTYAPVISTAKGGSAETVVLTAVDRAASLTLASQEKFAPVLVNAKKWNNTGLTGQFRDNAQNVMAEVSNVLGRLQSNVPQQSEAYRKLARAIEDAFQGDLARLNTLVSELPDMAAGTGKYSDRPVTTVSELETSVVYKTKDNRWFRVSTEGKVYEGVNNAWKERSDLSTPPGQKPDVPGLFFRQILFPDYDYKPRSLTAY